VTALVTGASGGLGRAIAVALAQDGHDVAVHFRSDEVGAVETSRLVESTGRRAYAGARDLAIAEPAALDEAVEGLLDEVIAALGSLDVVVLNAFPQDLTPWADLDAAAWASMLDGGLRPTAALLAAAGKRLSRGGVIVAIGSIEGLRPAAGHTAYAVSKAAVHHLTAAAAHELGPAELRVVGVAPGLIERDGLAQAWPDGVTRWERASALGRMVTPEEVAAVVAFLASPAAAAITGVTIPVDAGWSASPGW
jgi:3-oxoacyl-[acyl-carrier protein] reductase